MPIFRMFDPLLATTEFVHTLLVVILFFLIYHSTKEIYQLTNHKGIKYFRTAFLLWGIAYVIRLLLFFFHIGMINLDLFFPIRGLGFLFMLPVGYLSTLAIFYLVYSTIWNKISHKKFVIFSNVIAIVISLVAFISRSPIILALVQIPLLLLTLLINKKKKSASHVKILYLLITVFWLINVFTIGPRQDYSFHLTIISQIISIGVIAYLYSKVRHWTK